MWEWGLGQLIVSFVDRFSDSHIFRRSDMGGMVRRVIVWVLGL